MMRLNDEKLNKRFASGFTLVEIIVSVAIVLVIGFLVGMFGLGISKFSTSFNENVDTQGGLIQALGIISQEARSMEQSNIGSYPIDSAASSSFVFYSDIDGDGLFERVRYFLTGNILKKGFIKPTGNPYAYNAVNEKINDIINNMSVTSTPIFSYYDSNFSGSEQPMSYPLNISNIRLIKISLSATQSSQGQPISFNIYIMPRSLKSN